MNDHADRARPRTASAPLISLGFVIGTAMTAIAGLLIQVGVVPATELSEDYWRYPWESAGAFVTTAVIYAALHVLVIAGLVDFGRHRIAGSSTAARRGVHLAVAGTTLLLIGELASIPLYDAQVDDNAAMAVGALFGVALACSAAGFLASGWTTLRSGAWTDWRRFTPMATGIWTTIMIPLTLAEPTLLPGSVAVYGLCLLGMAAGMAVVPAEPGDALDQLELQGTRSR